MACKNTQKSNTTTKKLTVKKKILEPAETSRRIDTIGTFESKGRSGRTGTGFGTRIGGIRFGIGEAMGIIC